MIVEKEFDKAMFIADIKEELEYLGMSVSELSIRSKISTERLRTLFHKKYGKFKPDEIQAIEKVLGMN